MSIQHNIYFESGLLRVDASGEFSLEDAKQAFLELLGAVVQHKAEKILLDGRNVTGKARDIERFYYGEFAPNFIQGPLQRSRLFPPDSSLGTQEYVALRGNCGSPLGVRTLN